MIDNTKEILRITRKTFLLLRRTLYSDNNYYFSLTLL